MALSPKASSSKIPFGQEFTPSTLGKTLGEDRVLGWLLETAAALGTRTAFSDAIQETCLAHVPKANDRRDMASHVITALRNYKLIEIAEDGSITLTRVAERIRAAERAIRARIFARHILISCQGQRLVDAILRYQLRGERAFLEDLATELEGQPTSKSLSAMRAWLAKAGVIEGRGYKVNPAAIESLLGSNVVEAYALKPNELELVNAVALLEHQSSSDFVRASEAVSLAKTRNPHVRIPRKSLSGLVKALGKKKVLEAKKERGVGGTGWTVRLLGAARELTADELRQLVEQSDLGYPLHRLLPLDQVLRQMEAGSTYDRGIAGEMLAVYLCLTLGLRVESWRRRAPAAEIDLIADRTVGLAYQRWSIQVKNTSGNLDIDRVDREIGAAVGLGVTHVLFIVPRAGVTQPALAEMLAKSRITGLQVLLLDRNELAAGVNLDGILKALGKQVALISLAKRTEARRRELGDS